jgi:hypothetical protein
MPEEPYYDDKGLYYDEDKRLRRLGIKTGGDVVDVMIQLDQKQEELEREIAQRRKREKEAAEEAVGSPPAEQT